MNEEKLFHIGITRSQGAKYAVLPGTLQELRKLQSILITQNFLHKTGSLHLMQANSAENV